MKLFTRRQLEVFVRWMRGMTEREIAMDPGCGKETVRTHLARIRADAGISGKVNLINVVRNLGRR